MPNARITAAIVKGTRCPANKDKITVHDSELTGFMLEVRASGTKTYSQRYRDERGKRHQFRIGDADVLTVAEARKKAREIVATAVLGDGTDAQTARQERRSTPTLNAFVADHYLPHIERTKRSHQKDKSLLNNHILPDLGSLRLDEITADHITAIVTRMVAKGYKPGTLNGIPILISTMLNLARKWKVVPRSFENPAAGFPLQTEHHRERFLDIDETDRLLNAIENDPAPIHAKAVLLLLVTGARRSEIINARWEHVDLRSRTLYVPRSKSGKPRRIALNTTALTILETLPKTGPFLFGQKPITPTTMYLCWDRIRTRAGLADVRLHDLRHSFASVLVNKGVSIYVVQHLLGHTQVRTTQRYAHLSSDTLQTAAELVTI